MVDSGAALTVCPIGFASDLGLEQEATKHLQGPDGTPIAHLGQRTIRFIGKGITIVVRFHVAAVNVPVLSASDMIDLGHTVCMNKTVSYIDPDGDTRYRLALRRANGAF